MEHVFGEPFNLNLQAKLSVHVFLADMPVIFRDSLHCASSNPRRATCALQC